ncbi:MAG TPA: LysE family transporter [Candidatus Angelobacter sp.]|nr:LysE family transporter [Candidatus Angelobacter sp.]
MNWTSNFLLKGAIIGFSIAAPVGPIGVLCIRRSLSNGRTVGLVTGLGAATADATYGAVAGFGLTAVSSFLIRQKFWLSFLGGIFLCYLGARTFISKPAKQSDETQTAGLVPAYLSTLILTFTNPTTILSFIAVFAGLGLAAAANYTAASQLVAGVFFGSALWWLLLSSAVAIFRARISEPVMQMVNRVSGCLIFSCGIYSFYTL